MENNDIQHLVGQEVIIRTYSAGVWFGTLEKKCRNEVVLKDARRLWYWKAKESISLSGVAAHGIIQEVSKIAPSVASVWLEAIEIIELSDICKTSIREAADAVAG